MEIVKNVVDMKIYKMSTGLFFLDVNNQYPICEIPVPNHVLKKAQEVAKNILAEHDYRYTPPIIAIAIKDYCTEIVKFFHGYREGVFVYNGNIFSV